MSRIKLLIVDDHTMFLDSLKTSLESNNNITIVDLASDGFQAIEKARALKPDIVLMDITMPNLDGIKAASEIKKDDPTTKIILLTMHANNEEYVELSIKVNVEGYVLKTASLHELEECINKVYSGRKYFDKSVAHLIEQRMYTNNYKSELLSLTLRERQIITFVVNGLSSKSIAFNLGISINTVNNHKSSIFRKLKISSSTELVKIAIDSNLVL